MNNSEGEIWATQVNMDNVQDSAWTANMIIDEHYKKENAWKQCSYYWCSNYPVCNVELIVKDGKHYENKTCSQNT